MTPTDMWFIGMCMMCMGGFLLGLNIPLGAVAIGLGAFISYRGVKP